MYKHTHKPHTRTSYTCTCTHAHVLSDLTLESVSLSLSLQFTCKEQPIQCRQQLVAHKQLVGVTLSSSLSESATSCEKEGNTQLQGKHTCRVTGQQIPLRQYYWSWEDSPLRQYYWSWEDSPLRQYYWSWEDSPLRQYYSITVEVVNKVLRKWNYDTTGRKEKSQL